MMTFGSFPHTHAGLTEAIATSKALENIRQNRSFVLSRSTFPGSGSHTAKWTGKLREGGKGTYIIARQNKDEIPHCLFH